MYLISPLPLSVNSVHHNYRNSKYKVWFLKAEQEKKRQKELEELHEKKKQEEESWRKKVAYFVS